MAFRDKKDKNVIKNNTAIDPHVEYKTEQDKFAATFADRPTDLASKAIHTYRGTGPKRTVFKTDSNAPTEINGQKYFINKDMVKIMDKIGLTGIHKKASGVPVVKEALKYQKQDSIRTSTIEAAVQAWEKIEDYKKKHDGSLYVFDLETYGGQTRDHRWAPAGITEFAMQKYDFATGTQTSTSILMTNDDTIAKMEKLMQRYNTLIEKGIDAVKEENDVYVFAMRMSLHDKDKGARFELDEASGIWKITQFVDSEKATAGDKASVNAGYQQFVYMNDELKKKGLKTDKVTGLSFDQIALIKATGEMSQGMKDGSGVVAGHNILHFDRAVLDQEIVQIYEKQVGILNSDKATKEQKAQAQAAVGLIENAFGDHVGINFKKGQVLDTFPLARAANNDSNFNPINLQLGTLYNQYYEEMEGTAHLGEYDTRMNLKLILDPAKDLNGKSLVEHLMDENLKKANVQNKPIEFNEKQVFKATNNVFGAEFGGKGYLNHRVYSNGEVFTSGGYRIKDGKVEYNEYLGNTGFDSGGFYTVKAQGHINVKDLDEQAYKELKKAYPELSTDNIYYMSFASHNKSRHANAHTVNLFASTQEEMEALIGSRLTHVANITATGYETVKENEDHLKIVKYNLKTKRFSKEKAKNETELVTNAIIQSEKRRVNEGANRGVFNHEKAMQRIGGIIAFDEEARKLGYGDAIDTAMADGINFNTLIKSSTGKFGGKEYLSDKELAELNKLYIKHLGYIPKDEKEYVIDFRTKTNTSAAYETVMAKKEYYKKLIEHVEDHFDENASIETKSEYFKELDRKATVDILKKNKATDQQAIEEALRITDISTRDEAYYKNRYEFILGNKFIKTGDTAKQIKNIVGVERSPEDLVVYDVGSVNANSNFLKQLYKLRMGDDESDTKRTDVEMQKKQAAYDFMLDMYHSGYGKELFAHSKELAEYVDNMISNEDTAGFARENFDPNQFLTLMGESIKRAKEQKYTAGIKHIYGDTNVLVASKYKADILNAATADEIKDIAKGIKKVKTYNKQTQKGDIERLVQVFGIDDNTFNTMSADMTEDEKITVGLIRNITHKQLRTHIEDLFNTANEFDFDIHVDELNRELILEKDGKFLPIDKMPKLNLRERGNVTLVSGGSEINVGLSLEKVTTKKGDYTRLTTNVDSDFGKKDHFLKIFRSRFSANGKINLSDYNKYIGPNLKDTFEASRYTGLKTDLMIASKQIDLSAAAALYPDLLNKDGRLSHKIDDIHFANPKAFSELRRLIDRVKKNNPIDEDSLPPDLGMLSTNSLIELAFATLDPDDPNYDELMKLKPRLGASNKETQYTKGRVKIGGRMMASWVNQWDNPPRPPMTGAGNINLIKVEDIKKLRKFNVMAGGILESEDTLDLIYKDTPDLNLVSDFKAREALMSGPMIQKLIEEKKDSILKNKSNIDSKTINALSDQKLEEVLKELNETLISGTFEQARVGDARVLNHLLDKPIDEQYLSLNKDIVGAFSNGKKNNKVKRLNDLFGDIEIGPDGKYTYVRRSGTMVRKGEVVAEYRGYGNITQAFGSKFDRGVLFFSISSDKQEYSDEQISDLINQYSDQFDAAKDDVDRKNILFNILQAKGLKATYKIENANMSSLVKLQDSGVEKGMTHNLNVQLGRLNEGLSEYFDELQKIDPKNKMISNFKNGMIPTERAIRALHEDIAYRKGGTVDEIVAKVASNIKDKDASAMQSMEDLLSLVQDERESLSELTFGEYGYFPGITILANDNIPKHENFGLAVSANVNEAIFKYSEASGQSMEDAAAELAEAMNQNDNINFLRHTVDNSTMNGIGHNIRVNADGTLVTDSVSGEESFLDDARLVNFMLYTNDLIEDISKKQSIIIDESMKLVHKDAYVYNKDGELVRYTDKDGNAADLIGNFTFTDIDGKKVVSGSTLFPTHSFIQDSETESGVSAKLIEAMEFVNKMSDVDPSLMTKQQKDELARAREFVAAQKDHVKFIKADDQMLSLLERQKFDEALEEDLVVSVLAKTGKEQYFTEEKLEFLSKRSGGAIKYDKQEGTVRFSDDIRGGGFYDGIVNQIYEKQYYNDTFGNELTEDMLQLPEYSHLKEVYNDVVGQGRAERIGVRQAQNLYDLQGMAMAADFNDPRFNLTQDRMQNMLDNDFEIMKLKDYIPSQRSSSNAITGTISDKRIILDLGEDFADNERYLAIPAGGQQIGDADILTQMQGRLNQLKRYSDNIQVLEGGGKVKDDSDPAYQTRDSNLNKIREIREQIVELSDRFSRKDTLYTTQAKVEITEASDRLKILSITSATLTNDTLKKMGLGDKYAVAEDSTAFMQKAKVIMQDGSEETLYNLSEKGVVPNFRRVGIDHFVKEGFLDENYEITPEKAKEFGFNTQQMIEYLETYGSADMSIRYPLIRKDSMYAGRVYLDRQFDGKNITSISSPAALMFNADSDGDSESTFMTRIDNVSFALFEHQFKEAARDVRASGTALSDEEFQSQVKQLVLSRGKVSEDAYEGFYKLSTGMNIVGALDAPLYSEKVKEILAEDIANNTTVGTVNGLVYQIKNAQSKAFSQLRMASRYTSPSSEEVVQNLGDVRKALDLAINTNPSSFNEDTLRIAKEITSGTIDIDDVLGQNKYAVLDHAMHALESDVTIDSDIFDKAQQALTTRVRMQQYFEEETSKSTKGAIGSVNKTLNSIKIVANKAYGMQTIQGADNSLYDPVKAAVIQTGAEKIEQQVISGKKVAFEIGDTRLVELEEIMSKAKAGDAGLEQKRKFAEWMNAYLDKGSTNAAWNDIRPAQRVMMEAEGGYIHNYVSAKRNAGSVLSDADLELQAKNQFIADTLLESTAQLYNDPYWGAALKDIGGSGGLTSSSKPLRDNKPAPEVFLGGQTNNILRNQSVSDSNKVLSNSRRATTEPDLGDLADVLFQNNTQNPINNNLLNDAPLSSGSGLGLAVLATAATIMAVGYAGGGHSKPARAQDDSQEQEPPRLDNMDGVSVGMNQQGYVININADTRKGSRNIKRTLKEVAKATQNSNVSINMNYRTTNGGGYSNKDIENVINNFI